MEKHAEDMNNSMGNISVNQDVLARYAANATLNTEGVSSLYEGITDAITKNFLGKESVKRAVKLDVAENDEYTIDIFVIVKYAVRIPEVAFNIQKNVKKELEELVGITVKNINIHIEGIHFPEEDGGNEQ